MLEAIGAASLFNPLTGTRLAAAIAAPILCAVGAVACFAAAHRR